MSIEMSAELTVGAFVGKFWGAIAGVVTAAVGFIVGYVKLNNKVDEHHRQFTKQIADQSKRIDSLDKDVSNSLAIIRLDIKELSKEVKDSHKAVYELHIQILEKLNSK